MASAGVLTVEEGVADSIAVARRALTDEQEQAVVRREGSLLLAAGAGSGKTSVLVERFVRAVLEDGVAPGRILAITFTERAAGELRERVRERLSELGARELARETEGALVSTFHGFCARLLRGHPLQAGVEPGFRILEESFADRLRVLAFGEALTGLLEGERSQAIDVVAAYGADPLRSIVLGAYAQLRSQGQIDPSLSVPVRWVSEQKLAVSTCALVGELLERFGVAYAQRKQARGSLDFDDLELMAGALLRERSDVRDTWAERFQLLMVDEFQDTSPRQLELLGALDRDNLFTVGDELQSIYGFRHADVNLFRERQERLSRRGASLALTRNFRSRPAILDAVQRIFAQRMGERFKPIVPARDEQTSNVSEGPSVELLLTDKRGWERAPSHEELAGLADATPWRQAEARLLAGRLAQLVDGGEVRAGEIVVLLRSLGDLPVYESALRRAGLRTLAGVGGFWTHQQVGDMLAWLRALANPLDELALYSTLASPLVGISSDGLALLARMAREQRLGVWRTIERSFGDGDGPEAMPQVDRERLVGFRELFATERRTMALHPIGELLRRAIAASGYERHVLSLTWGERRLANVQKLIRMARAFEAQEGRDLRGFLDHVTHAETAFRGREADAPVAEGDADAVRLLSIHAAKGLEFPVVCVADLGREPNLRVPDLLVDGPTGRVGLRLAGLDSPELAPVLDFEELCEERQAAQLEEEDRILYVACTRAERRLLLSGAVAFERWPAIKPGVAPIAWLAPVLVPDAPRLAEAAARMGEDTPTTEARSEDPPRIDLGDGLQVSLVLNCSQGSQWTPVGDGSESERLMSNGRGPVATVDRQPVAVGDLQGGESSPVPVPLKDPDGTISYTSLVELQRCGYRYYLERVLRLAENRAAARSENEDAGIQARTRGTIVHMLLEAIDFSRPRPPSVEEVGRVARQIGASVGMAEREQIAGLIAAALQTQPAERLRSATRVRHEHPFAFSLGAEEPLVTGVLDMIAEQPDGTMLIVDYKSDRLTGDEDLELVVQRDYGTQRLLYALAAIEGGAREVEVAHWFLERPREWKSARFLAGERDSLREDLRRMLAEVRASGFAVTDEPHRGACLTCPGRGGLCSWGETHTMRERSPTLEFDG